MPDVTVIPPSKDDALRKIWDQLRPQLEPIIMQALQAALQSALQNITKQPILLPPPEPPKPPITPVTQKPSVQIGVLGVAIGTLLQALGVVGTPFGMGTDPTMTGTLTTLGPALIAMTGLTGVWGTVANVGLNVVAGLLKNRIQQKGTQ